GQWLDTNWHSAPHCNYSGTNLANQRDLPRLSGNVLPKCRDPKGFILSIHRVCRTPELLRCTCHGITSAHRYSVDGDDSENQHVLEAGSLSLTLSPSTRLSVFVCCQQ